MQVLAKCRICRITDTSAIRYFKLIYYYYYYYYYYSLLRHIPAAHKPHEHKQLKYSIYIPVSNLFLDLIKSIAAEAVLPSDFKF